MSSREIGFLIAGVGVVVVVVGLLIASGGLGWFGRLPGDIRLQRGPVRVYAPLASMLLVSVVLSLLIYLARRFF